MHDGQVNDLMSQSSVTEENEICHLIIMLYKIDAKQTVNVANIPMHNMW